MAKNIKPKELSVAISAVLSEYSEVTAEKVKDAVKEAGKTVKKEIEKTAPKDTGAYRKSWKVKTTRETENSIEVVVHSKTKYQLAHLLEHGHAKRNGGRTPAQPHIAPAEQKGIEQFKREIDEILKG